MGEVWKVESAALRKSLGAQKDEAPWTKDAKLWGTRKTDRVKDLLDLAWLSEQKSGRDRKNLLVDYSLSTERAARGFKRPPCLSRKTQVYSFAQDRSLCAEEMGGFLGFGHPRISWAVYEGTKVFPEDEARELFANSMDLASVGSVLASAILAFPGLFKRQD